MKGASFESSGMELEHHCPNGHVNACSAQTKNVHVCQECGETWMEDLAQPPAEATPRPLGKPAGSDAKSPPEAGSQDETTAGRLT